MSDFERKFGKYAVRDLSLKLIILYLAGYALYFFNSQIIFYLTLNPYAIVHGQIWRIFSWLLIPPSTSNLFFIAIMMFFYYSIGTSLERVWGTWRYNVFIFTGILLTVAASFVWMGFSYLTAGTTISAVDFLRLCADLPGRCGPDVLHHPDEGQVAGTSGRRLSDL